MLKPMLARGMSRCIGATTVEEYQRYIQPDAAFERRFKKVYVREPTMSQTIDIIRGLKEMYENYCQVQIEDKALVFAAHLSSRYITGMIHNPLSFRCSLILLMLSLNFAVSIDVHRTCKLDCLLIPICTLHDS